jgi:hypothetical protein
MRKVAMATFPPQLIQFYIEPKQDIQEAIDQFVEDTCVQVGDQNPEYRVRAISTAKGPYGPPASRIA